jgi:hypothetical protein
MAQTEESIEDLCHSFGQRVCPIYRLAPRSRQPFLVGTGIPFQAASQAFLISAAHVLDEFADDTIITFGRSNLIRFKYESSRYGFVRGSVDLDIGVIRLPKPAASEIGLRFHFSNQSEIGSVTSYSKHVLYCVVGYPHTSNRQPWRVSEDITAKPFFILLREFSEIGQFSNKGKRETTHFALAAPKKRAHNFDSRSVNFPLPQGMSGGGVWRIEVDPKRKIKCSRTHRCRH